MKAILLPLSIPILALMGCTNPESLGAGSIPSRQPQAPAPISYIVQPGGGGGNLAGPPDGQLFSFAGWANMIMPYVGAIGGPRTMQWYAPGLVYPH